jgi:SAM-dependent methyltransferase
MIALQPPAETYDAFACCYDAFTAHHDYDRWTADLLTAAGLAGRSRGRLLDVGAGTGKSWLPLARAGWDVTACDVSAEMLRVAAAKVGDLPVRLLERDARRLERLGEFDVVWALDDVANYLHSETELEAALAGMRRNLAPGGVVVFDANTLASFCSFFASTHVVENDDHVMIWRGAVDPQAFASGALAHAQLDDFSLGSDGWARTRSRHTQRHHPLPSILRALAGAGLAVDAVLGMTFDGELDERADERRRSKTIFIARSDAAQPTPEEVNA